MISYLNSIKARNFTLKILNEALVTNQIVFYFTKNFYLVDEVNEKISQFKASGLLNLWMSKYAAVPEIKSTDTPTSLKVINLQGTFELFVYGLIIATTIFLIEVNVKFFRRVCGKSEIISDSA